MVSERAMREIYLKGFGICVREAQPKAVMTSYNLLNGTHTAESRGLIMDILRAEFGYEGIVMTDWVSPIAGDARSAHRDSQAQYVAAAGGDLFMPGNKGDYDNLLQGIASGAGKNQCLPRGQNGAGADTRIKHKNLCQTVCLAEVFWVSIYFSRYSIGVWPVTS